MPDKKTGKDLFLSICLLIMFIITGAGLARASVSSVDLSYRHVSGTIYQFRLVAYYPCTGSGIANFQLKAKSSSLGVTNYTLGYMSSVWPAIPITNLYNCSSIGLCMNEQVFVLQVDIALANPVNPYSNDWIFYTEQCCTPGGIMLPENIATGTLYTECGLNNLDFPAGNHSPVWHMPKPAAGNDTVDNHPIITICADQQISLDEHAEEYNDDSLHYEFVNPLTSGGSNASTIGGYSTAYPLPAYDPPGVRLDSLTGELTMKVKPLMPNLENYVIAMKVTGYDTSGAVVKKTGFIMRYLNILVQPVSICPGQNISIQTSYLPYSCSPQELIFEMSHYVQCKSIDTDGSLIKLTDSAGTTVIPVKSAEAVSCISNRISSKVRVELFNALPPGKYKLAIQTGTDGNSLISECGTEFPPNSDEIDIFVNEQVFPTVMGNPDTVGSHKDHLEAKCGQTSMMLNFNVNINCSTIHPAGTDFRIVDSTGTTPVNTPTIISATPVSCFGGSTNRVWLNFLSPLQPGYYRLYIQTGLDSNSVGSICGEETPSSYQGIPIIVREVAVDLGPDTTFCIGETYWILLEAPEGYPYYLWSTGDTVRQIIVNKPGTYKVTIGNQYNCYAIDAMVVVEQNCAGVAENSDDVITMYPNPSGGIIYFQNNGVTKPVDIFVYAINGSEVFKKTGITFNEDRYANIDLTGKAHGLCFVKILAEGEVIAYRKIQIL